MSAALVRQALEFVDPDESSGKGKKRGASRGARRHQGSSGQVKKPLKPKFKKQGLEQEVAGQKRAQRAVTQLLKLSRPTVHASIADKIVERAVRGKALADKIEVNNEPQKSILFSDEEEDFDKFEEELFCS